MTIRPLQDRFAVRICGYCRYRIANSGPFHTQLKNRWLYTSSTMQIWHLYPVTGFCANRVVRSLYDERYKTSVGTETENILEIPVSGIEKAIGKIRTGIGVLGVIVMILRGLPTGYFLRREPPFGSDLRPTVSLADRYWVYMA